MARPTIKDLAKAADVSVATVNRVLAGAENVRLATRQHVQNVAARIGFYGLGAIQSRVAASRPKLRLGALLLQPHRPFYKNLAQTLREAAAARADVDIDLRIDFIEDLSPQNTADHAKDLARHCQAVGIVSAVHPIVTEAINEIERSGVKVFSLVAPMSSTGQIPYIGLDNWKLGRTAAWGFAHLCRTPGKIGILVGNPRYRNQEMTEAGFRSYLREFAPDLSLLEPQSTFESAAVAQEITEHLLVKHHDLAGLYVNGGGVSGAIEAVRAQGKSGKLTMIGHDLTDTTRSALLDDTLTILMSHSLDRFGLEAIDAMVSALQGSHRNLNRIIPFEVLTRENL
ncbi:LacI family DNA-binding transcriptional regulator [Thioclava sp. FR2]|uniref:LacI family DNA-binding transcriptional regulator n=1 Tax=Thioclava sp. FR2 TaxID=3445780 RepID=UPI003EB8169C